MSTPENQPDSSGQPDQQRGQSGNGAGQEQPRYGQNPPQYGQQSGPYGQNQPQYGQYGQNTPQYGQNAPGYGQQPGSYGQGTPSYGQNAPQQGQYGQQPGPYGYQSAQPGQYSYPSSQPQPGSAPARPKEVTTAFWLIIAAAVFSAIEIIYSLATMDTLLASLADDPSVRDALSQTGGEISEEQFMDMMGGMAGVVLVIVGLIMIGLYLMVAFGVKAGKNWARITGTVFAALSLLGLFPFGLHSVTVLLGVAAIVLLFLPASNEFFKAVSARKFGIYGR
ncbi:hypothetical protein D477_009063 [Arthrobacter crystallopoietes BAB-32]|uniref:Uncharacterized protein n=1 Tax=Arthrobacter crystallopoietes BAB-32 TaxID=1246476 RepID=N1V395_9MICC|nr:hypothetical protein [Arthrobacter crystallopoietes]EMY34547.1 hypothetical protein D477_009063 [Arthrobacter crystallopoietes BAB-32]